ncbi:MAG: MBL fold metallo-hydrolase [Flavobacteriales bacterium]|nr:MBL fold metallo-hydrolase [Flavobacteriales bacterium]
MANIKTFVFSPFHENTYVLYDDNLEATIIDPGCYGELEEKELMTFIQNENLKVTHLLNTHCHIDHVFGNKFVCDQFQLRPIMHKEDLWTLNEMTPGAAQLYGLNLEASPQPEQFVEQGDIINVGQIELEVRFTPGHAPGHVVFVCHKDKFVINGDCLFEGSIGRTDFPKSDHETLLNSIRTQLFTLDDDYVVHTGHGAATTIGSEKKYNPFLQ